MFPYEAKQHTTKFNIDFKKTYPKRKKAVGRRRKPDHPEQATEKSGTCEYRLKTTFKWESTLVSSAVVAESSTPFQMKDYLEGPGFWREHLQRSI